MTDYSTPRLETWRKWTDGPLLVLAIGSLPLLLSQAMALIPGLAATGSLRAIRAGRAFRAIAVVFRLAAIGGVSTRQGRALVRKHAARFVLGFAGVTAISAAVGFTLAEDVGEHGRVHSFADAAWWSASTMTTLGTGDIEPKTAVGRMIALVAVLVGITAGAIITAKVAEFLVRTGREDAAAAQAELHA